MSLLKVIDRCPFCWTRGAQTIREVHKDKHGNTVSVTLYHTTCDAKWLIWKPNNSKAFNTA